MLSIRVPESFVAQIKAEADRSSGSFSDALRCHIVDDAIKPLSFVKPRRRPSPNLAPASGSDVRLLAMIHQANDELARIGRDTLAHHAGRDLGTALVILGKLRNIEQALDKVRRDAI